MRRAKLMLVSFINNTYLNIKRQNNFVVREDCAILVISVTTYKKITNKHSTNPFKSINFYVIKLHLLTGKNR